MNSVTRSDCVSALEQTVGYTFQNKDLAGEALTHASRSHDGPEFKSNERLEFLGDAVLQIIVSNYLFHTYPDMAEGQLTRLRAAVVSAPSLKRVADGLGLGGLIQLGKGMEQSGGRENVNILADAVEAVLAAIYLDSGIRAARSFILPRLLPAIETARSGDLVWDPKTKLQEILQRNGDVKIEYIVDDIAGPAHDRVFTVSVAVEGRRMAQGQGKQKKSAQQDAARRAIEQLEQQTKEGGM